METNCEYCQSANDEGALKCVNCGAPIRQAAPDFRACPYCRRRLLALASPNCSYCGRRLPEHFLKVRESDLRRLHKTTDKEENNEVSTKVDELIRRTAGNKLDRNHSLLDLLDFSDLTDLFS